MHQLNAQSQLTMSAACLTKGGPQPITSISIARLCAAFFLLGGLPLAEGLHHMAIKAPLKTNRRKTDITPLLVTNRCPESIWPGISTQSGSGPSENGFELKPGETKNQTVSEDWQGRLWGRTNCSFNDDGSAAASGRGKACATGDCAGALNCKTGVGPAMGCNKPLLTVHRVMFLSRLLNLHWTLVTDTHTTTSHWLMATIFPWQLSYNHLKTSR
jgi:hypothetical protein